MVAINLFFSTERSQKDFMNELRNLREGVLF